MDKAFQHDYAKAVSLFVQKMPAELPITTQEIDAYFRQCILYLMSFDEQMKSAPNPGIINQIYTEEVVAISPEQIAQKLDDFHSNKDGGFGVPDFFRRLLAADAASGTRNCCEFIRVQQEIFTLYATYEITFSFEESRRASFLSQQLTYACIQAGVAETAASENIEANTAQNTIKKLNDLFEESAKSVSSERYGKTLQNTEYRRRTVEEIVEEVDREFEALQSSKRPNEESNALILNLSNGKIRETTTNGSLGKIPNWVKKPPQTERDKRLQQMLEDDSIRDVDIRPSVEESLAKLNKLIGLDSVKRQIQRLANDIYISGLRPEHGLKTQPMSYHLIFSGNPGTGKTTVARIVSDIYAALGIVSKGQLVEVDRSGLVAGFEGQTEEKTSDVIKRALGGVLFIDEAYALTENGDEYGKEAVDTILKAMEDHYDDFVVIAAGYDELMKDFVASNPGLKSRFSTQVHFDDYNGEDLYKIFLSRLQENDDRLDEDAVESVKLYFQRMYERRDEHFANGRDVRNFHDKIRVLRSDRIVQMCLDRGGQAPTTEELQTFTLADIKTLVMEEKAEEEEKKKKNP